MLTDIEIAQQCRMRPITEIAATAGIDEEYLEQYGRTRPRSITVCWRIGPTDPMAS